MSPFSELGPLDVQLLKPDEIGERRSGLIARSALASLNEQAFELFSGLMLDVKARSRGSVRFKMAADIAVDLASRLLAPVYGQINPINVGEDHRDLNVALEYGKRLCDASQNINQSAIDKLVHGYPSHDFVIDAVEAASLFRTVEAPAKELYELTGILEELAYQPQGGAGTVRVLSKKPEPAAADGAGKDSVEAAQGEDNVKSSPTAAQGDAAAE